jgi:NADPH:quinone reductase-like Zn-dependent oxidoreductase
MKASILTEFGEADKLRYQDIETPKIREDEVLVRVRACSLNHLDIWIRKGLRQKVKLPHVLGSDIAGEVEEVGKLVEGFKRGDRVVIAPGLSCGKCEYCLTSRESMCERYSIIGALEWGGYAEYVKVPLVNLIPLPQDKDFVEASAFPLTFLTAWHMLITLANIKPGDFVLVWAAGSGVGSAAIQIAKLFGAKVITTVGSDDKAKKADELLKPDLILNHYKDDIVLNVKKFTNGKGADIVFDSVGKATWKRSLESLARGGTYVNCGVTSGSTSEINLAYVFRKQLKIFGSYMGSKGELLKAFSFYKEGKLKPIIDSVFNLKDAGKAHERMEKSRHFGKIVLIP